VEAVAIPVIASSGAGAPEHFTDCFQKTNASAALAAGILHRQEVDISDVKRHMADAGLPTRVSHVLDS
jgi:imidazole glycerol-phosphate synthase